MAIHHFTMLVAMVTSTLLSISSERNTVTHHVRTMMADTPLHYACDNNDGHLNIAQYLIREEHCNPSCENNDGYGHHFTMLVLMVTSTLLSISSERNTVTHHVRTMYGYTPLHYACTNGHLNIAQYLIREEHCNPSCENNMAIHHFTGLVLMTTPTLYNICYRLVESIH